MQHFAFQGKKIIPNMPTLLLNVAGRLCALSESSLNSTISSAHSKSESEYPRSESTLKMLDDVSIISERIFMRESSKKEESGEP